MSLTHDPICPVRDDPMRRDHCGVCIVIADARTDERARLVPEGWVAPEAHHAIVATAKVRAALHEREAIAAAIEATADDLDWPVDIAMLGELSAIRGYGKALLHAAAQVALNGGGQ